MQSVPSITGRASSGRIVFAGRDVTVNISITINYYKHPLWCRGRSLMIRVGLNHVISGTFACVLAVCSSARGDSVLDDWAPNFATLDTEMHLIYEDIYGLGTKDDSSASGPHVIANSRVSNHYDSIATPPTLLPGGGSSYTKDYISGRLEFNLDFGSPVFGSTLPDDTFSVNIQGVMSAMDAHNAAGHKADAIVDAKAVSKFYIDATYGGGTPGTRVGFVLFPKLELGPFDTVKNITVAETDPLTSAIVSTSFIGPHPDVAMPILGDRFYEITFEYEALVPYGVDPPYQCPYGYQASYGNPYGGGASGVPEP